MDEERTVSNELDNTDLVSNQEEECDENEFSEKDRKVIKRMEKIDYFLNKITKKINELESEEFELNNLDDKNSEINIDQRSVLKKRSIKAYDELCKLCRDNPHLVEGEMPKKMTSVYRKPITYNSSEYEEINNKVTHELRRRAAIKKGGRKKEEIFPDYFDVHEWVAEANKESNLKFSVEKVKQVAEKTFKNIGGLLKKRRIKDVKTSLDSRLENNNELEQLENLNKDEELNKKLIENEKQAIVKQDKIFEEFVEKQEKNIEPEENSETESESDDENNSNSEKLDDESTKDNETNTQTDSEYNESSSEEGESKTNKKDCPTINLSIYISESESKLPIKRLKPSLEKQHESDSALGESYEIKHKKQKIEKSEQLESDKLDVSLKKQQTTTIELNDLTVAHCSINSETKIDASTNNQESNDIITTQSPEKSSTSHQPVLKAIKNEKFSSKLNEECIQLTVQVNKQLENEHSEDDCIVLD